MRRCKIEGIDLVIRTGIRAIAKLDDARTSTLILVRGATGTGKTLFGTQLALDAAAERNGDVAVGLLEMLPTELRAQLTGIQFFQDGPVEVISTKDHTYAHPIADDRPRVFASIIDVPYEGVPDIGYELHTLLLAARALGVRPTVLLIDAVSRGYRLGDDVSRELADGLSKLAAEHGLIVIVLEEANDPVASYSPWMSVADVVLELALRVADERHNACRTLVVRKSRFNDSSVGPHTFVIRAASGIEIFPGVGA